jgi:hypothetical protein
MVLVFLQAARNQRLNPIPRLQDVEPPIRGNVIEEKAAAKNENMASTDAKDDTGGNTSIKCAITALLVPERD